MREWKAQPVRKEGLVKSLLERNGMRVLVNWLVDGIGIQRWRRGSYIHLPPACKIASKKEV
jgi:hypothetical protein